MNASSLLDPEYIQVLSRYGVIRGYPASTLLFSEGDGGDHLYVVLTGSVRVFVSDERGREVILNSHGPGEFFGELALIDQAPRSASVVTLEPVRAVVVTREAYYQSVVECPALSTELVRSLPARIRSLTDSLKSMALHDVHGRVIDVLVKLARQQAGNWVLEPRPTHQEIANRVGASREMVSRVMKDLVGSGHIVIEHKRLYLRLPLSARW
jgi:CRP/FNR family cyclic AMP-dependent transcriptional regulator